MSLKRENAALELSYFKTIKGFLGPPGMWPSDTFGEKVSLPVLIHRETLPYHTSLIVLGALHYLFSNIAHFSFLDMGQMILITFLATLTAVRSIIPTLKTYYLLVRKFIREFHLINYTHKGDFYQEMSDKIDKISVYCTKFMMLQLVVASAMFNVAPAYNNIKNVFFLKTENYTLEFSLYMSYPGFKPLNYFTFTTIYNYYLSYNCGVMLCGIDLILFLMIFQVIGHINILRHNLENFESPKRKGVINLADTLKYKFNGTCTYEIFDAEENEIIRIKLAECVDHHRLIMQFTDELSDLFGPIIAFNYLFHLVGCCLLLLECTSGEAGGLVRYGFLTITVFGQLIQISSIFEMLGSESEKLKDSVYIVPWQYMSVSNQRTVGIMLHKMQSQINLKALGMAAVGVNTMTAILKTTLSYYAFLQTLKE